MGYEKYVLDKILKVQMLDGNGNVITEFKGLDGVPICETIEKPIKLVYEGGVKIESNGDYDVTVTRKLTLSEIAELFGVDEVDVLDGKIGILTLDDNEES